MPRACLIEVTFLSDPFLTRGREGLSEEEPMKTLAQNAQGLSVLLAINIDRLLVPLLIVAALTLAGWLISYATVY